MSLRKALQNRTFQAFLILLGILNIAFFSALWGGRTLMTSAKDSASILNSGAIGPGTPPLVGRSPDPGAPAWQFEPSMALHHNLLVNERRLALWNPYAGYGTPWAAGMQQQPFFPLSFLLSLYPTPQTVDWFYILRLLIAGIFSYLFFRFFTGHLASLAGAIASMLTGYFILFVNNDHLTTEVLLPAIFYAFERLLRDRSYSGRLIAVIAVFLSIVAGMPESTFLIITYGCLYFLFRLATCAELRKRAWTHLADLITANIIGFACCAFLLLPFVEFLHRGLDSHRSSIVGEITGLIGFPDYRYLLTQLLPLITGPALNNIFTGFFGQAPVIGYVGIAAGVCSLIALVSIFRRATYANRAVTIFFALATAGFVLKCHGHPSVNWIGYLPLFDLVFYPKYVQPLIGFSVAALCSLGCEEIFTRRVRTRDIVFGSGIMLGLLLALSSQFRSELSAAGKFDFLFYANVIAGLVLLLVLTVVMLVMPKLNGRWLRIASLGIVGIVGLELLGNYIYPVFYRWTQLPSEHSNPYKGAPYVQLLQQRSSDLYRVFGREAFLFPNWSSAFGLHDVRFINGLNHDRYFYFIRAFLAPPNLGLHGDLADRFTGEASLYNFSEPKQERFLQLSSIRYLVSGTPFTSQTSPLVAKVLDQNRQRIRSEKLDVRRTAFTLAGETREVLYQHPPASIQLNAQLDSTETVLTFSPALDPAVFEKNVGDGVEFAVHVQDSRGAVLPLYRRYIDPKHNAEERKWLDERIDLSQYAGREITLIFRTAAGPNGDSAADWAGWGGLRLMPYGNQLEPRQEKFQQIYDGEARVFEYTASLPRASIFYSADIVPDAASALNRIQDPRHDVWRRVVIAEAGLPSPDRANLRTIASRPPHIAEAASIRSYQSQSVVIEAKMKRDGLVLLTDANYPGWNAYLDGRRVPVLEANYLFRGVWVPAGEHVVEFVYEPLSYWYGTVISLLSIGMLGVWVRRAPRSHSVERVPLLAAVDEPAFFAAKRVFITGGSSGIGKQLAKDFLQLGAHVSIVSNDAGKLAAAEKELRNISKNVTSFRCDISRLEEVRGAVANYVRLFGAPDVLINNAGYAVYQTFEEMTPNEIERLLAVNLVGPCLITREFLSAMIERSSGHIVMMASIAGRLPLTPCGVYCAAKHGLVAWAETLQTELRRFNIGVHVICPGRVETDFFTHPTFQLRAPRAETKFTVSVEEVSRATITAIQKDRFVTYVPGFYAFVVWVMHSWPLLIKPFWRRLMNARIESIYGSKNGPKSMKRAAHE